MTDHIFYNFEKCVNAGKQCKVLKFVKDYRHILPEHRKTM